MEAEAQTHYKAVCCALVSESLELSKFMEKVKRHETESDCKELQVFFSLINTKAVEGLGKI